MEKIKSLILVIRRGQGEKQMERFEKSCVFSITQILRKIPFLERCNFFSPFLPYH